MIPYVAKLVPHIINQVSQAPTVIQCLQKTEPDSWLKWLLPTVIQTFVSLASIAAGVLIAVNSFRANSKKEHKQWILGQKKAEWRELLKALAKLKKKYLPIYEDPDTALAFIQEWENMQQKFDPISMPFIFIAQRLKNAGFFEDCSFMDRTAQECAKLDLLLKLDSGAAGLNAEKSIQELYTKIETEYNGLVYETRLCAEEDLNVHTLIGTKKKTQATTPPSSDENDRTGA
jgi:hypothetical protein